MTACTRSAADWYLCAGCRRCTCTKHLREYYMVANAVWRRAGVRAKDAPGGHAMLCIGCLEERLGRPLARADFLDCGLNTERGISRSNRLWRRLTTGPGPLAKGL